MRETSPTLLNELFIGSFHFETSTFATRKVVSYLEESPKLVGPFGVSSNCSQRAQYIIQDSEESIEKHVINHHIGKYQYSLRRATDST